MTFLFLATIGPVQPFIASARRTRDLYVGSTLLSELSKAGAFAIAASKGYEQLIFPAPLDKTQLQPDTSLNVANKLVAIITTPPEQLGEAVYTAIQQRLRQVKEATFGELELHKREAADAQLDHLIEYSWVAVDLSADQSDYQVVRERAEAILGARKNTRFFAPVTWGDNVAKSSIDGERESVIPEKYFALPNNKERNGNTHILYADYRAKPHERLSAVDLLKRLAWKDKEQTAQPAPLPLILSTSHIAATPFLQHLEKMDSEEIKRAKALWEAYIRQVERILPSPDMIDRIPTKADRHPITGDVDGALLFPERLLDDMVGGAQFLPVSAALDAFFTFTDQHLDGRRPSPYYAILLADGDGMGNAIDAQAEKGPRGPEGHRAISTALAGFAKEVRELINDTHHGSLVYAGGDDVLALLPLHTAIQCAEDLHAAFQKDLSAFADKEGHSPTLSVGIAIAHHVSLLQDALEVARTAERHAKDYHGTGGLPDKNALAVIVKKRGGEQNEMVVSWLRQEAQFRLLITLYNANILPDGMAYELRSMMQRLQPSRQDQENTGLQKIVQIEAARILRRKLYFSQQRAIQQEHPTLAEEISRHLNAYKLSETMRKKLVKPHEKARYILLQHIGVQERDDGGFDVLPTMNIAPFINALIVAQAFTETLTPARGVTE